MNTTITTAPTTATVGRICTLDQLAWTADDWADAWHGSYEHSVVDAADGEGELSSADLAQLLRAHGFSVHELIAALAEQAAAGHACLPLCHAGQALTWLGY